MWLRFPARALAGVSVAGLPGSLVLFDVIGDILFQRLELVVEPLGLYRGLRFTDEPRCCGDSGLPGGLFGVGAAGRSRTGRTAGGLPWSHGRAVARSNRATFSGEFSSLPGSIVVSGNLFCK